MSDLTTSLQRVRVSREDSLLLFLEVTSDSFTGPLRIVADTQDWTSNGVEYVGVPFGFKLPDDTSGQSPRAVLTMSNVGQGVTEELERLSPGEIPRCKLMIADKSDPDTITKSYNLPMVLVSASGATVTAQLGVDYLMRQQAVRIRANAETVARPS